MLRINYDEIAHLYDEPGRDHDPDQQLLDFLNRKREHISETVRVLDVGCGTGKQLAANHNRLTDVCLIGVDRSRAMLRIAQERSPTVAWIQADGVALPFAAASCGYATSQFSYQHIGRTRQFLTEVFRVLKSGGRFVMTNIDPWSMPGWLVYQYFPDAVALDHRDFLPVDEFVALMRAVGFEDVRVRSSNLSRNGDVREFLVYASSRHRASQLTAISDRSYDAGLRRLKETVATAGDHALIARSELVLVMIAGDKSSSQRTA